MFIQLFIEVLVAILVLTTLGQVIYNVASKDQEIVVIGKPGRNEPVS